MLVLFVVFWGLCQLIAGQAGIYILPLAIAVVFLIVLTSCCVMLTVSNSNVIDRVHEYTLLWPFFFSVDVNILLVRYVQLHLNSCMEY